MESTYDEEEDILDIQIKEGDYWKSIELSDSIILDIAKDGSILSIEILSASKIFLKDAKKFLEAAKA